MTSFMLSTFVDVLAILLTVSCLTAELTAISGLQCYICDSTSHVSYSDAETKCNAGSLRHCSDTKHSACMIEAFKRDGPVYHVVKKCRKDCPVLINSTAQHIRCCFKDACNDLITIGTMSNEIVATAEVEQSSDNVPTTTSKTTVATTSVTPDYYIINTPPSRSRPSLNDLRVATDSFEPEARQRPRPSTSSVAPSTRRRWPPRRGRYPPTRHNRYGRRPPYRSVTSRHAVSTYLTTVTLILMAYHCTSR